MVLANPGNENTTHLHNLDKIASKCALLRVSSGVYVHAQDT